MKFKSWFLTKQHLPTAALGLLFLFSSGLSQAQITPLGDAFTNSAEPTTNYGSATLLYVDGAAATTYIQFNLASIPSGATVSQATLKLYVNAVTTAGSFNVDYVNGSWAESTITHNLAPALGSTIVSDVPITAADKNQYVLVNVTSAVQAWLDGSETNNGLALVANSSFYATFDSKENTTTSHPAELDIAFAGGDGTITGVKTASGSGLTGGGTSGTLNLGLTEACSSGQVLSWNGSAWVCTALGGGGTITGVTAGTALTGGGTSGTVTLNLNTTLVPLLAASNVFSGSNDFTSNNTFSGNNLFSTTTFAGNALFEPATTDAIDAYASTPGKTALVGIEYASSGGSYGVYAITYDLSGAGVAGVDRSGFGTGVYGYGAEGGYFVGSPVTGGSGPGAVVGQGADNIQYDGEAGGLFYGGQGDTGNLGGDGLAAFAGDPQPSYAGYFGGNVTIDGNLSKSGGSFKIDHPLDPANKYLYHSFVESPDMMNIYNGNVTTDAHGDAVVELPEWFEALNRDFRYQLTVLGQFAQAIVSQKVADHHFAIKTDKPEVEVSWQVTGIRQDAWANAHRIPVEENKLGRERGFYLHPELFGAPPQKSIAWARHPEAMKKLQGARQSMQEKQVQPAPAAALLHGITK
jgi:TGF-beta propeptide